MIVPWAATGPAPAPAPAARRLYFDGVTWYAARARSHQRWAGRV